MRLIECDDGSFEDETGKIIFFSVKRFLDQIILNNHCFICGAKPGAKSFNDEHILPEWLLKKYDLFDRQITIPNLTGFKYDKYKISCCCDCNARMGRVFEEPISELVKQGFGAVANHIKSESSQLFLSWLCLIFIKTHLKDRFLRTEQDRRSGNHSKIADQYEFEVFHHIHCLARSFYTGAIWEPGASGSFLLLPAMIYEGVYESFDFADRYSPQSILLRMDDMCLIAVLNDGCAASSKFYENFKKIDGPLSPLQLREVLAHLSYISLRLKNRPSFKSKLGPDGSYRIYVNHAELVELEDCDRVEFGEILYDLCKDILATHPNGEEILKQVREGMWQFLFDDSGNFVKTSIESVESQE